MSITGKRTMPDGTELFTETWPNKEPIGTVLIIHGVSEYTGRWSHVAEFLVGEGFEVHSYDQRAHGRSGDGVIDIRDFNHYVDDVAHTIADIRQQHRPLILYGHSMGALVAALYAQSDHEQPDLLILSAPPLDAKVCVPAPLRIAANAFGGLIPTLALKSAVEQDHLSRNPAVGEAYVNDPLVYLKGTTRFGKSLFAAMDRGRADIDKIRVPTLVVHGADDELVPPRASAPLAAVPYVERRVFPGLRHEMHNEPESVEVLSFISGWVKKRLNRD